MSGDHAICPACGGENLAAAKFCGACGHDLSAPVPAAPAPPSPEPSPGPKHTMLGMSAVPMPPGLQQGSAQPAPPPATPTASAPEPAPPAQPAERPGSGRARTMLGMTPIAPPGQALPGIPPSEPGTATPTPPAPAPEEAPAPTASEPAPSSPGTLAATTNRTMLGMPQVEIEKAAAVVRAAKEAEARGEPASGLGPTNRTMLGMTAQPMPGSIRESQPPGPPAATPPAGRRRRAEVQFDGVSSVPPPPPKRGSRAVVVVGILGVLLLLMIGGGLGLYLLFGGDDLTVRAAVVPTEAGDGLKVEVGGDGDATHVRFGGQEVALSDGAATFPLAADSLHLGDNQLTVELIGESGEPQAHEVTLTVSYRIRADVTTLTADPPALTIVVDAIPGSEVTIGGEPVSLDADGHGQRAFPIDTATSEAALEHRADYHVSLPDGQEHAGSVETRVPYATLQVDRPGSRVVTDAASVEIAGAVSPNATLTIDGDAVTITDEGRFVSAYALSEVGEHAIRLVARQPGRAPRVATLTIRRVADLAAEAASFAPETDLTYARLAQNPTIYRDRRIALEGRIYNINVANGQSVLQMLVRECPRGERCPLWVTYPQATDVTINDWVRVLGTVGGEQQFRSESGRVITVPRVDAQFVLPSQAR